MDFLERFPSVAAAIGTLSGQTVYRMSGYNGDIDIAAAEVVQSIGGTFSWPGSAQALEIASGSAADAAAGTGARTVRVDYLDSNWAAQSVVGTMNGVTPVALGVTAIRVNRLTVITAGSGTTNAGLITVAGALGGDTFASMTAGDSVNHAALYSVPDGKTAALLGWWAASGTAAVLTYQIRAKNNLVANSAWRPRARLVAPGSGALYDPSVAPVLFGERCDIEVRATTSADNAIANTTVSLLLIDETQKAHTDL